MTPADGDPESHPPEAPRREFPAEADFLNEPECNVFGHYTCFGVTDKDGRLVHEFTPTRNELKVLAQYYLEEVQKYGEMALLYGQVSSHGRRFEPFAYRRIKTIELMIGEHEVQEALAPLRDEWDKVLAYAKEHPFNPEAPEAERVIRRLGFDDEAEGRTE